MATKPVFPDVPAWPGENPASAPAPMGHNMPPIEERIPAEFREAILAERENFYVLLDQLLGAGDPNSEDYKPGSVQRVKCTSEEEFKLCGDLDKRLRACEGLVADVHAQVKKPYWDAGKLVDAQKNVLDGRIKAGRLRVLELQKEYQREQQRKADEERKRLEEERAKLAELAKANDIDPAAIPEAPRPPKAEPIRTDGGTTISAGKEWKSQVEDYTKAFKHVRDDASVREAVDKAIQRIVKQTKGQKALTGVRIYEDVRISNR